MNLENQLSDHHKACLLSFALAAINTVRNDEPAKSFRERKMMACEDFISEVVDNYRPQAWPSEMMQIAGNLCDETNLRLANLFPKEDNYAAS